jgi:hypothetical protein
LLPLRKLTSTVTTGLIVLAWDISSRQDQSGVSLEVYFPFSVMGRVALSEGTSHRTIPLRHWLIPRAFLFHPRTDEIIVPLRSFASGGLKLLRAGQSRSEPAEA